MTFLSSKSSKSIEEKRKFRCNFLKFYNIKRKKKTICKSLQVHNGFGIQIWCNAKLLDNKNKNKKQKPKAHEYYECRLNTTNHTNNAF